MFPSGLCQGFRDKKNSCVVSRLDFPERDGILARFFLPQTREYLHVIGQIPDVIRFSTLREFHPTSLIVDNMEKQVDHECMHILFMAAGRGRERDYLCRFLSPARRSRGRNAFYCETTSFGSSEVLPLPLLGGNTKSRAVNR